ncbi:MAG: PilN domain-containing protein [Acidobacteriota bacterium]|nr:PilN domain-containing protein [Acidobacteriota bacterium]
MIRINLLEISKTPAAAKPKLNLGKPAEIAGIAIIVLAVAFVGLRWYSLSSQITNLKSDIRQADAELADLQDALKLIDTHKKKKAALNKRVELISNLKRRQQVPVHLLDQISRELPDFLWLEGLEEKGGAVKIKGKATTYNAVSNFYNNLSGNIAFSDVTLGNTRKVPEGVSFGLSCRFTGPTDANAEAEKVATATATPRG